MKKKKKSVQLLCLGLLWCVWGDILTSDHITEKNHDTVISPFYFQLFVTQQFIISYLIIIHSKQCKALQQVRYDAQFCLLMKFNLSLTDRPDLYDLIHSHMCFQSCLQWLAQCAGKSVNLIAANLERKNNMYKNIQMLLYVLAACCGSNGFCDRHPVKTFSLQTWQACTQTLCFC